MPFPFSHITDILEKLEDIESRDPPYLPADKAVQLRVETTNWFKAHRRAINELEVGGSVAFLSALLPERRTDRVYGLQATRLCRLLSRGLGLSAARAKDLQAYRAPRRGDLAVCLQRAMQAGGPPAKPSVTLEEVDAMLFQVAEQCHFSAPTVRSKLSGSSEVNERLVCDIVKRLSPQEGKWLVRLLLKDFAPVRVDEHLVLKSFHFLLPDLLRFQNDFGVAMTLLKEDALLRQLPEQPDPRSELLFKQQAASSLRPVVGVKVGRPDFTKARSIEHCLRMFNRGRGIVERKYDGEYCEIHVDLSKSSTPAECIQIFSKSGKDSTTDRQGLHHTLVECLNLAQADRKVKRQAILLGELVVFSDETKQVLSFDEVRKHITRSGVSLGTSRDLQARACEHLAVVFFDLLLWDDEVIMRKPVEERRQWLREIYRKIPGRAMGAEWKIVDFAESQAKSLLLQQFCASNAQRCEGLVLKPCGVPYFRLGAQSTDSWLGYIKLKKDYIAGMGDEADFAVVGASHNAQRALKSGVAGIKWTDYHLGCLLNADEVQRYDATPVFQIVHTMQPEGCIPKPVLESLNTIGKSVELQYRLQDSDMPLQVRNSTAVGIDVVFARPMVLEVLGSGFSKPSDSDFYMLRHARATKLHEDRTWKDCVSFNALQEQAHHARDAPAEGELQETRKWLAKME
ncbi:hypothetical protein BAUCODRAFT_50649, partial [Baudoinia panamericana UAMH 10762]